LGAKRTSAPDIVFDTGNRPTSANLGGNHDRGCFCLLYHLLSPGLWVIRIRIMSHKLIGACCATLAVLLQRSSKHASRHFLWNGASGGCRAQLRGLIGAALPGWRT